MRHANSDGIAPYLDKIRHIPVLSREEEYELATRARKGDKEAADRLVEANLRYVVSIALKFRRYGIPVSELVAEGSVGLMTAVQKFEPERGNRFVTYAGYWIRAFVLDYVVRSATMVGGGSGPFRSKLYFRLRRERAKLLQHNIGPTEVVEILAKQFGLPEEKMRSLLGRLDGKDVSLNQPAHTDSQVSLQDTLPGSEQNQETQYIDAERQRTLSLKLVDAMEGLDRREKLIVEKRILGADEASLAALGRTLGVSRERARQLEARAKEKLRKHFAEFEHEFAA